MILNDAKNTIAAQISLGPDTDKPSNIRPIRIIYGQQVGALDELDHIEIKRTQVNLPCKRTIENKFRIIFSST
jgi:hypothetical protein